MQHPIKVLVLEDVPADAELTIGVLKKAGFAPDWERVATEADFLSRLKATPELILADYTLPQFNAKQALRLVRRQSDVPFIVVTGSIGEDLAVELMRLGADDYILKDRMGRLGEAVRQVLTRARLRRERDRAEQAHLEEEKKLRQIADNTDDVLWLMDPATGKLLYVNSAYERIWGRSIESLYESARSWQEALHPEDRKRIQAANEATAFVPFDAEYRIVRPDGSIRWIQDKSSPIWDAGGKVTRMVGVAQDITERKEYQRRLETQYAVARVLADAADLGSAAPKILEAIARSLGFQTAILWEVDAPAEALRCVDMWYEDSTGNLADFVDKARQLLIRRGAGIAGEAWNAGRPVWFSDVSSLAGFADAPEPAREAFTAAGLHCAVAFPIVMRGEILGVADFFSTETLQPDPAWLDTLTAIGNQLGQFMERRSQHENILRLNRIATVQTGINAAVVRNRDREALFREACRIAVDNGGFPLAWIGLLNPESLAVVPVAWHGSEEDVELIRRAEFSANPDVNGGQGTVGVALRTSKLSCCNDLARENDLGPARREALKRGYRAVVSLPLFTEGKSIGVMALYSKDAGWFDEQELGLLSELAGDISFALDFMKSEERVQHLAYHDALTGLPNRGKLRARLTQVMDSVRLKRLPFALLLMNINNFRDINDTLGHNNGDVLLQQIAARLSGALWESDVVACLGGDEYAMLLPHLADRGDIELVIAKIMEALRMPFVVSGVPINVDIRLGIALYPDHGDNPDLLWQHADVALRASKQLHRSRSMYSTEIDHYDPARLSLIGGLREAIDHNELVLHFQPKINLKTGHTRGVEALLRWQHPERGLIYPDAFIPAVERTSLIDPLTTWTLANAMRQGQFWQKQGLPLEMSVNLSARNLQNPNLGGEILDLVRSSRFSLANLTLEITETAIMVNPVAARNLLTSLWEADIRFAIDDFGIGQTSLAYLKDLPVSEMKIDKSFVMSFNERRNAAIVRSAIDLGHNLGLAVTAEGVEDEKTCKALLENGCDTAQGYFFSKPLPPDQLVAWLRDSRWPCAAGAQS